MNPTEIICAILMAFILLAATRDWMRKRRRAMAGVREAETRTSAASPYWLADDTFSGGASWPSR